jgi:hypothetical protein
MPFPLFLVGTTFTVKCDEPLLNVRNKLFPFKGKSGNRPMWPTIQLGNNNQIFGITLKDTEPGTERLAIKRAAIEWL